MPISEIHDLQRMAQEARSLATTLPDPKARELMEEQARLLETEAAALERHLKS